VNQLTSESADRQKHQAYSPIHRLPDIRFAVFDTKTKSTFLKLAKTLHKHIDPDRIVVTGPPVDPRITNLAKNKPLITKDQPVNIGITTGGLGTNLPEIKTALTQLAPLLEPPEKIRLFLYAGTHQDFRSFFEDFAAGHDIRIGNLDDQDARIRILYEDSVIDANNNLINYLFPWAQVIITKPSGDMAYDAAAAGCALLFLQPWGEWEENIQSIFIKNRVGRDLNVPKTFDQLSYLIHSQSLQNAQTAAKNLPSIFREGAKNIVNLQQRII
jgi:UDP-N-acetylglucosamine:LPS N-acetylglucosamine transferase